jgi:hypothetical protein
LVLVQAPNSKKVRFKNKTMKALNLIRKTSAFATMVALGVLLSCQETEEIVTTPEAIYAIEETATDAFYQDADDLTSLVILNTSQTAPGGRLSATSAKPNDNRFCDNTVITVTLAEGSTVEIPKGNIVIDFGTGCTDALGNVRKGKIKIQFEGRRFQVDSKLIITFDGYSINQVSLAGTRTLTNITGSSEDNPTFKIELVGGSASWPDGTNATRVHCFIREWDRGALDVLTDDQLLVSQCPDAEVAASGKNRRGINYEMVIESPLVYKRGCPIAVSGVKVFTNLATGQEMTIDYGTGTCDRMVTITVNGQSKTVEVGKR